MEAIKAFVCLLTSNYNYRRCDYNTFLFRLLERTGERETGWLQAVIDRDAYFSWVPVLSFSLSLSRSAPPTYSYERAVKSGLRQRAEDDITIGKCFNIKGKTKHGGRESTREQYCIYSNFIKLQFWLLHNGIDMFGGTSVKMKWRYEFSKNKAFRSPSRKADRRNPCRGKDKLLRLESSAVLSTPMSFERWLKAGETRQLAYHKKL